MTRFFLLLLACAVMGCRSMRLGPYTAPCVTGRVLAADSGQPLSGVEVQRGVSLRSRRVAEPPKGAELLIQKPGARTDNDGHFTLPSERALTVFRPIGWNMVRLTLQRAGYERFQTNFSFTDVRTNTISGEPLLNTGDIRLSPVSSR